MTASLTLTALDGVPTIGADCDLVAVIAAAVERSDVQLRDNDILILAQKIVSKAEGRAVSLSTVTPPSRARELAAQLEKDASLVSIWFYSSGQRGHAEKITKASNAGLVEQIAKVPAEDSWMKDHPPEDAVCGI